MATTSKCASARAGTKLHVGPRKSAARPEDHEQHHAALRGRHAALRGQSRQLTILIPSFSSSASPCSHCPSPRAGRSISASSSSPAAAVAPGPPCRDRLCAPWPSPHPSTPTASAEVLTSVVNSRPAGHCVIVADSLPPRVAAGQFCASNDVRQASLRIPSQTFPSGPGARCTAESLSDG